MKAWICWGLAAVLFVLGLLILPGCVREARRISRLDDEGVRVAAEITGIEELSVSTTDDTADRARYGTHKTVEDATVRYSVGGREYSARHRLPEPIRRHHVGDPLPIIVLPDDPTHSYATYDVTGSWVMSFLMPTLLLGGAGVFGFAGSLLRRVADPGPRGPRRG
jgi:hypothetical protein